MKLGALTRQLRVRLTGANFASVFDCIVATLRVDWEKAIRQSKFNMLGGIMFEKDVREIQRHLEQECGVSLRQKFARLVHTADVLAVEGAADVKHIVAAAGSVAGSASLSRDETRAVLANRIDITEKDIAALNI
ncbi:Golgi transport complex subunit 4 [Linderina macrospora]|uniref:Golgi transport complex subunit 4 n=1 Tax=Linderina macrospora TaxID=4868 RepID=A0ACC1J0Z9_9FUNG|nr:Golgi transport complex subunit 4 [Linderina macrospora]